MRSEKVDQATARSMIAAADKEVFSNPAEIAKLLNQCIAEAKKLDTFPHALHGEDYEELIQTQQDVAEDILQDVFGSADFNGITLQTLHAMYSTRLKESNPGQHPLSSNRFAGRVMSFLMNNKLNDRIKRSTIRVNAKIGSTATKAWVFYDSTKMDQPTMFIERTALFLTGGYLNVKPKVAMVTNNILAM
jgi:hypothetical protein